MSAFGVLKRVLSVEERSLLSRAAAGVNVDREELDKVKRKAQLAIDADARHHEEEQRAHEQRMVQARADRKIAQRRRAERELAASIVNATDGAVTVRDVTGSSPETRSNATPPNGGDPVAKEFDARGLKPAARRTRILEVLEAHEAEGGCSQHRIAVELGYLTADRIKPLLSSLQAAGECHKTGETRKDWEGAGKRPSPVWRRGAVADAGSNGGGPGPVAARAPFPTIARAAPAEPAAGPEHEPVPDPPRPFAGGDREPDGQRARYVELLFEKAAEYPCEPHLFDRIERLLGLASAR